MSKLKLSNLNVVGCYKHPTKDVECVKLINGQIYERFFNPFIKDWSDWSLVKSYKLERHFEKNNTYNNVYDIIIFSLTIKKYMLYFHYKEIYYEKTYDY